MGDEENNLLLEAIGNVASLEVLLVTLAAACYGLAVGSIPGLTATMAVALMVPLTAYLSDVQAIAAIVTTVTCSIFAGDLPATLLRIPGTPASAAYANDAYALTKKGKAKAALATCLWFSIIGGLFGTLVLALAAPQLAALATQFTSYEYFWLYVLGLSCAVTVSNDSRLRGMMAMLLGLLLSTVGLATDFSTPRMTFGWNELITGVHFIPAMIGLFGLSEVLKNILHVPTASIASDGNAQVNPNQGIAQVMQMSWRRKWSTVRSSFIGSLIGMLPGAGADIASWISYATSKRFSKQPTEYGKGSEEGLADATGANNAALGGAWIPALVFGIPGDSVTAIALGVLLTKNISPGPAIFEASPENSQLVLVLSLYVVFVLANLMLLPLGLVAIRAGTALVRIPRNLLLPLIVLFCVVGSYSMSGSYFDVWVMLVMGVLGFGLERLKIPLGPAVLGLIMGGALEHRFIQSITTSGSLLDFVSRPMAAVLATVCVLLWLGPLLVKRNADQ
ncbi:MAG: tripartite tricarboxylate transporter permease [Planctomycetota bacterium]|nr:tripartite tricarboxylate transporter permease [Planctomycetota bacterium]